MGRLKERAETAERGLTEEMAHRETAEEQLDDLAHVVCDCGGWTTEHSNVSSPAQDAIEALAVIVGQRDDTRRALAESRVEVGRLATVMCINCGIPCDKECHAYPHRPEPAPDSGQDGGA